MGEWNMKPMLAAQCDLAAVQYPVLVSPKLDGIRGLVRDGVKDLPRHPVFLGFRYLIDT